MAKRVVLVGKITKPTDRDLQGTIDIKRIGTFGNQSPAFRNTGVRAKGQGHIREALRKITNE